MTRPDDNLERLVSRYLDDECTESERHELDRILSENPRAEALFEESAALDREFNYAMRGALGKPLLRRRRIALRRRLARAIPMAVAAAIGFFLLSRPAATPGQGTDGGQRPAVAASWFGPAPEVGDSAAEDTSQYNRPQVRLDQADRNWVVVPGAQPGEYLVIEVTQVRTRTIRIQGDF